MSRISEVFKALRGRGEKGLIPYIMAGDPSVEETGELVLTLEKAGADIIELGVPFTDPIADGPVIQKASERALTGKVSLRDILSLVRTLRGRTRIPLVLMTYYNPLYRFGEDRFVKEAVSAGVDGVIVPDLPPEEAKTLMASAKQSGLDVIFLLAPTSTQERISRIALLSSGFIYYVSLTGITGAPLKDMEEIKTKIAEIRRYTSKPIAVGFGISTAQEAALCAQWADAVVVGSAIVRLIGERQDVEVFVRNVKNGVRSVNRKAG